MNTPFGQIEDEWANFSNFELHSKPRCDEDKNEEGNLSDQEFDNFISCNGVKSFWRLEDLVHKCEENVASCFRSDLSPTEGKNHLQSVESNEDILARNELWKCLTDKYGLVPPLDWPNSHIYQLHMAALQLDNVKIQRKCDKPSEKNDSEDSELRKQLDLHRLFNYSGYVDYSVPNLSGDIEAGQSEQVQTADEVIQELEEIMLDAEEQDAAFDNALEDETGIVIADTDSIGDFDTSEEGSLMHGGRTLGSPSSQEESDRASFLKTMNIQELQEELSSMENTVKLLSEELLTQLNLRDELRYGKEVRNTFISKILEVQYKQEQFQQNNKAHNGRFKMGKLSKSFSMSNASAAQGRYLTTVIPVEDGHAPTLENIQAMMKLLDAIKEDSDEVPSLITNYILKVLCPAPSSTHTLTL